MTVLSTPDEVVWHNHPLYKLDLYLGDRIAIFQNVYTNQLYRLQEEHQRAPEVSYHLSTIKLGHPIEKLLEAPVKQSVLEGVGLDFQDLPDALETITKFMCTP